MKTNLSNALAQVWFPLSDIPNQAGFKLVVARKDGSQGQAEVIRDVVTGCHSIKGETFSNLASWRKAAV